MKSVVVYALTLTALVGDAPGITFVFVPEIRVVLGYVPRVGDSPPVPLIAKLYGLSSQSSLAMLIVALRTPVPPAKNIIVNVTVPLGATVVAGCNIKLKSDALGPVIDIGFGPSVNVELPVFSIVKVRE